MIKILLKSILATSKTYQEFQFSIGSHVCKILMLMVQNKALSKNNWYLPEHLVEVSRKVEFEIQTKLPNLLRPGKKASVWRISNELVIEVDLHLTLSLDSDFLKSFFCGQINQLPPCMALKTPWNRLYKVSVKQS